MPPNQKVNKAEELNYITINIGKDVASLGIDKDKNAF
jgi:hypothetical protein